VIVVVGLPQLLQNPHYNSKPFLWAGPGFNECGRQS
jgi:hypothetical protein